MGSKRKSLTGETSSSLSPPKKGKADVPLVYLDSGAVQTAFDKSVISSWERSFYADIMSKDVLSEKQLRCKEVVELKVSLHDAKEQNALNEFEYKFALDRCGKADEVLSDKQVAIKKEIDSKLDLWRALKVKALSEWDYEFMVSNLKRGALSEKQLPIKERIQKQMEAATATLEARVFSEWELGFLRDNARKEYSALSEKQRPFMDRIEKKLQAWRAHVAGGLSRWQLDFLKDVIGKDSLSEKQQTKLQEIEAIIKAPAVTGPHSSDEELAAVSLPTDPPQVGSARPA